jgi:hypothetical protein
MSQYQRWSDAEIDIELAVLKNTIPFNLENAQKWMHSPHLSTGYSQWSNEFFNLAAKQQRALRALTLEKERREHLRQVARSTAQGMQAAGVFDGLYVRYSNAHLAAALTETLERLEYLRSHPGNTPSGIEMDQILINDNMGLLAAIQQEMAIREDLLRNGPRELRPSEPRQPLPFTSAGEFDYRPRRRQRVDDDDHAFGAAGEFDNYTDDMLEDELAYTVKNLEDVLSNPEQRYFRAIKRRNLDYIISIGLELARRKKLRELLPPDPRKPRRPPNST